MAVTNGPNLGVMVNGAQGEVFYNEFMKFLRAVDLFCQCVVLSSTTTAQPASPADGASYIIPVGATGAQWASQTRKVARYSTVVNAWEFYTARKGWLAYDQNGNKLVQFDGTNWVDFAGGGGGGTSNPPVVNDQTGTSYTLVLANAPATSASQGILTMNNASANTVTIPASTTVAFPIGTLIQIIQLGAGKTTVSPAGGVTLANASTNSARAQNSVLVITKIGVDSWVLGGDMQ